MDNSSTMFQDISRSVDQLCAQMSLANIKVPKPTSFDNIFDFMSEYELVTTGLSDNQRKLLLARAFSTGHHQKWFKEEIAPIIDPESVNNTNLLATIEAIGANRTNNSIMTKTNKVTWKEIKDKIIERFSDNHDQDRYMVKLRDLKFDPDGDKKLLDFVEATLYTYKKAFPTDNSNAVRYVKAAIPINVMPMLSILKEYQDASDEDNLKKAAKRYDSSRSVSDRTKGTDKTVANELAKVLKDVLNGIQKEGESTRGAFLSAFKSYYPESKKEEVQRPRTGYVSPRGVSPNRDRNNNDRSGQDRYYQRDRSPMRADNYRPNQAQRSQSPVYNRQRSPSPRRYENNRQRNDEFKLPVRSGSQVIKDQTVPLPAGTSNVEAFSSEEYYAKFKKPDTPCACGYYHWRRHCINHLN